RDRHYRVHIRGASVQMNRYDRARPRADCRFDEFGIDQISLRIYVYEDRTSSDLRYRGGGRNKSVRGRDDFIAFADLARAKRKLEGGRSRVHAHRTRSFAVVCELNLKGIDVLSKHEVRIADHSFDSRIYLTGKNPVLLFKIYKGNFHVVPILDQPE